MVRSLRLQKNFLKKLLCFHNSNVSKCLMIWDVNINITRNTHVYFSLFLIREKLVSLVFLELMAIRYCIC